MRWCFLAWTAVSRHPDSGRAAARIMTRGWRSSSRRSRRRAPVSAAQMVPILFRRPLDLQQRFFAMGEAIAHLNYLWRRDRVRRTLADDGTLRFAVSSAPPQ